MHPNHVWKGNKDMRLYFDQVYSKYFSKVYTDINSIPYSEYNLIIADDNRTHNGLREIYTKRHSLMVGCNHGNSDHGYSTKNVGICYDACFVFGQKESKHNFQIPGGIPCNDALSKYLDISKEHVLVIINQLGNYGQAPTGNGDYFKLFDEELFKKINLLKIQQYYNKPIVFKLKSRDDGPPLQKNIEYLHNILPQGLDYKIIVDVEDDNLLVAQSIVVIGAASAMMFKPIQLGIPTAMLKGYGQTGKFIDYPGLVEDNYDEVMQALSLPKQSNFIQETIQGGLTWNSTKYFLDYTKQLLNR